MNANKLAQGFCYLCAVAFLVAGSLKRSALVLTEAESFLALLLIFCVTLLFVCLGTLSSMSGTSKESKPCGRWNCFVLLCALTLFLAISQPAVAADPENGQWTDLLKVIDPAKHAVGGEWRKSDGGLTVSATPSARLTLPHRPTGEYDFRVKFTRKTGVHSIALIFVAGGKQATFEIDAWGQHLAGIQQIGGKTLRENPTRVADQVLVNGRTYTAMVRVRKDRIQAYRDDKLLTEYETDGADLGLLNLWQLPDKQSLGIGAYDAETVFHSIEVRALAGGTTVAATAPERPPSRPANPRPATPTPSTSRPSGSSPATTPAPTRTPNSAGSPRQPRPAPAANGGRRTDLKSVPRGTVLLVIANQDFFYREYADPRAELERAGFRVEVAAGRKSPCRPHGGSGQGADSGIVNPDLAVADADASKYVAMMFSGGWGSSMYQYAFNGSYSNAAYNGDRQTKEAVNRLINDFVSQKKYVGALCHGVSVLAWSRVNGKSLLDGRNATAPQRTGPAGVYDGRQQQPPSRWNAERNGAKLAAPRSIGNPQSADDDVVVDGRIITGEDDISAREFGRVLAERLKAQ